MLFSDYFLKFINLFLAAEEDHRFGRNILHCEFFDYDFYPLLEVIVAIGFLLVLRFDSESDFF